MGRYAHDGPRAIGHQHVVGDPDGDALPVHRVNSIAADEDPALLLVHGQPFDLALAGGLVLVGLYLCLVLRRGQLVHQGMLRSQHHEGSAPQGIGAGGEDDDALTP